MRWQEERYVRIYTRDTADWLALSWDAQSLLMHLLRKADRTGHIALGKHGKKAIAVLLGQVALWESRLQPALEELLTDGCIRLDGDALTIPNFIDAQEATASASARMRAYRERKKEQRYEKSRDGDDTSTGGDETCERVPIVTPSRAVPSRAVPKEEDQKPPPAAAPQPSSAAPVLTHPEPAKPKKPKTPPTPEQEACRRAFRESFDAEFQARSVDGSDYVWDVADKTGVAALCNACGNDPAKAKALLAEFLRRMPSDPFWAKNFRPAYIASQLNTLRMQQPEVRPRTNGGAVLRIDPNAHSVPGRKMV